MESVSNYIDHTNLSQTATQLDIKNLCKEAIENDFSSAIKYEISSITGKIVQRGIINSNTQQLDLTDLASDIYYISIKN